MEGGGGGWIDPGFFIYFFYIKTRNFNRYILTIVIVYHKRVQIKKIFIQIMV